MHTFIEKKGCFGILLGYAYPSDANTRNAVVVKLLLNFSGRLVKFTQIHALQGQLTLQ